MHLNYNHLHYFWIVATAGSIARAAESLHVTPQTVSGQIRKLEARLGSPLFRRVGRKLELTEAGQVVHSYVNPMFGLGLELGEVLQKRVPRRRTLLSVGVATGVGKLIAARILGPALDLTAKTRVLCHEAPSELLASALLAHDIDLAITDGAVASTGSVRMRSHLVGQCGVTFFCATGLAQHYRSRFPASLDGAPLVMPAHTSTLASSLTGWFRQQRIAPSIVAEIESPDLTSLVCESHDALFALPTTTANEIERKYRVSAVGEAPSIEQHFYLVCLERPAVAENISALLAIARERFRAATCSSGATPDGLRDAWRMSRALSDALPAGRDSSAGARLALNSLEPQ